MPRLAVLVFLLLALPLRANLGDTVAECVKRYGKPDSFTEANAKSPFGTLTFFAGPYHMTVFLAGNIEVGASVTKRDSTAFTPAEIQTILNADANSPWIPTTSDNPASPRWTRHDDATAEYDSANKILIFTSPAMAKVLHAPPPPPPAPAPPPRPPGNFAPAAPTPWAPPTPPSTNAPATNAP
jgi:hypothetical protein